MASSKLFLRFVFMVCISSLECRREQRATIKACISWGFKVKRIYNGLVAVWGDHTLSLTQVRHWANVFKNNLDRSTADKKRPGRLLSFLNEQQKVLPELTMPYKRTEDPCCASLPPDARCPPPVSSKSSAKT